MSKRNLHFEESEIWRLINHLLSGLKVLHDLQIVHRDLKCANIFIAGGCYKLGDLNVSKILKRGLAYTQTGTPYYASPEVWRDEPYDSKSDIWSLGCAVYEMCALRPPFQARNMEGLYRKVELITCRYKRANSTVFLLAIAKTCRSSLDYACSSVLRKDQRAVSF